MEFEFEGNLYTCVADHRDEFVSVFKDGYHYRDITWQDVQNTRLSLFNKDQFVEAFIKEKHK